MSVLALVVIGLLIIGVLALGGVAGNLVARDPGYVLISYDGYSVETSIWFAALLLLAAYFVLRLTVYLVIRLLQSRGRLSRWSAARRTQGAANRTTRGLLLMAEGEWSEAQRALVAAAPNAHSPMLNYLQAARAASALGDAPRREALLDAALESTPGSRLAVDLHRAELQQDNGDWEASLATLGELRELSPKHPVVQRLLINAMQRLGRYDALADVLPSLRKSKALGRAEYAALEVECIVARVRAAPDAAAVMRLHADSSRHNKSAALVALALGERALVFADNAVLVDAAERSLRDAINVQGSGEFSAELLDLYGRLSAQGNDQAKAVARWVKEMPAHPQLALAAARIASRGANYAEARSQLERALSLEPSVDAFVALAHVCSAQGDASGAQAALEEARSGMELSGLLTSPPIQDGVRAEISDETKVTANDEVVEKPSAAAS